MPGRIAEWRRAAVEFAMRRGTRDVGWSLAGTALQMALGVATTALLARILGPGGFGTLAIALAIAFTVSGLSDLGFSVAFVRLASPEVMAGRDIRHLHTVFLGLRCLVAALFAAAAVGAGGWLIPQLRLPAGSSWMAAAAATAGLTMAAGTHYTAVLQALRNQRGLATARTVSSLVRLAAYASLAMAGALSLRVALAVALLAIPAEAAINAWTAHRTTPLLPLVLARPYPGWLSLSFWVAVPAMAYAMIGQTDTLLLAAMTGPAEAGLWNAATRVGGVMLVATGAVWSVALPYATGIVANEQLVRYIRLVTRGVLALGVATAALVLAARPVILALFGPGYADSVAVLRLLLVGNLIAGLNTLLVPVALRLGKERLTAVMGLVEFAVNLGLDVAWIPRFGALGCAASTFLMHAAGTGLLVAALARALRKDGDALAASPRPQQYSTP